MTPTRIEDEWFVCRGSERLAGPFKTNGEAWRWIDRHEGEPISRGEDVSEWVWSKMAERA
ncbi:hypothetical protein ABIA23_001746 [Sinorhizobium fredii]